MACGTRSIPRSRSDVDRHRRPEAADTPAPAPVVSVPPPADVLLEIRDLRTELPDHGRHRPRGRRGRLRGAAGKSLGVVGESGSGKSVTALTVMRLLESNATTTGEVWFDGHELLACP